MPHGTINIPALDAYFVAKLAAYVGFDALNLAINFPQDGAIYLTGRTQGLILLVADARAGMERAISGEPPIKHIRVVDPFFAKNAAHPSWAGDLGTRRQNGKVRSAEKLKAVEIAPEFIVRAAVFNGSAELSVTREELLKHNTTDCQFGLKLQWACKHC